MNLCRRMTIYTLEDIDKVRIRVYALEPTGGNQTVDDAGIARANLSPAEKIVLASDGDGSNLAFQCIRIERDPGMLQKHAEFLLTFECIRGSFREWVRRQERVLVESTL